MNVQTSIVDSTNTLPCFDCEDGVLRPQSEEYRSKHPELGEFLIPNVVVHRCDTPGCKGSVLDHAANAKIDAYLDKALNIISPAEMQAFLTKYRLTQKEAAQITGYGEKNISRWARGRLRPSRSVSNFFRIL